MNDNDASSYKFEEEVKECHKYLSTGGLGEVIGIVEYYALLGQEKVQNDTALELAILELAAEGLKARSKLPSGATGPDTPDV